MKAARIPLSVPLTNGHPFSSGLERRIISDIAAYAGSGPRIDPLQAARSTLVPQYYWDSH